MNLTYTITPLIKEILEVQDQINFLSNSIDKEKERSQRFKSSSSKFTSLKVLCNLIRKESELLELLLEEIETLKKVSKEDLFLWTRFKIANKYVLIPRDKKGYNT